MRLTRTKLRYALARTPVRSFVVALRHLGLRRDDAFLSAYPRSGSTWVKFLLYEGLTGQAAGFEVSSNAIPHIGRHRRAPTLLGDGGGSSRLTSGIDLNTARQSTSCATSGTSSAPNTRSSTGEA